MARRKKYLDTRSSDNHERWLVSYSDFITLLFAFFVVMYAISSVNEGKYRVLGAAIGSAFIGTDPAAPVPAVAQPRAQAVPPPPVDARRAAIQRQQRDEMREIARGIAAVLAPLVSSGDVRVIQSPRGVTVEINASVLFAPGQAVLQENSRKSLRAVADLMRGSQYEIEIGGHTDNLPIGTALFPSNWELSAARASSVVRLFADSGADPRRMVAKGYGEYQPVASNATAEGRARNRRVTVTILAAEPEQPTKVPFAASQTGP